MRSILKFSRGGQSLIEITVALAVSFLLLSSAVVLISIALRTSTQNSFFQAASFLSQDLADRLAVFAESRWYCPPAPNCLDVSNNQANFGIYNLQEGSANHYYLSAGQPTQWVLGDESVVVNGVTYTRYFFLENVSRDDDGDIEETYSAANDDPSTQLATIVTAWQNSGSVTEVKLIKYLTRSGNGVFAQTDWSGGPTAPSDPTATVGGKDFFSSANINWSGLEGQIKVQ